MFDIPLKYLDLFSLHSKPTQKSNNIQQTAPLRHCAVWIKGFIFQLLLARAFVTCKTVSCCFCQFYSDMAFLCLFAHSLLFYQALASEEHQSAMLGGDATLQCQAPRGAVITVLEWSKTDLSSDDYVFFYRNDRSYEKYQHPSFRGRVELFEPSMKDGDVSIVLKNATFNDTGTYRCRIIMSNTGNSDRVFSEDRSLRVTEPDHTEEVRVAVGRLGKAVQNQDAENAESVTRVAVGLGAGAVCVVFLVVVAFVVYRKRHTSPKSKSCECPGTVDEHKIESQQMIV